MADIEKYRMKMRTGHDVMIAPNCEMIDMVVRRAGNFGSLPWGDKANMGIGAARCTNGALRLVEIGDARNNEAQTN